MNDKLLEIANDISDKEVNIPIIPSTSSRARKATEILNTILKEKPQYVNTIMAIATYPIQKRAYEIKESLGIDESAEHVLSTTIQEISEKQKEVLQLCGITPQASIFSEQTRCTENTKEIIEMVEMATKELSNIPRIGSIMFETVYTLHIDKKSKEDEYDDISLYNVRKYYKVAIEYIAQKHEDDFKRLINEAVSTYSSFDEPEERYAYHNTELLIWLYPLARENYADAESLLELSDCKVQNRLNGLKHLLIVSQAIESLSMFPDNGNEMKKILTMMAQGKTYNEIAEETGISRTTTARLAKRGITILSYILWGYSTRDVINGLTYCWN